MQRVFYFVLCVWAASSAGGDSSEDVASSFKNVPRIQYMKDLHSTLANADGRPIHNDLSLDPTFVLCLADYDIMYDQVRAEPVSEKECSSTHRFLFAWDSANVSRELLLEKSNIRVFAESWDVHIPSEKDVSVNISASVRLTKNSSISYDQNATTNATNTTTTTTTTITWDFVSVAVITHDLQMILEVDVTEQLSRIWGLEKAGNLIDVWLKFDVDCADVKHDKVPLKVINPATLDLTEPKRKRKLVAQPFLIVFGYEEDIRSQVKKTYPQGDTMLIGNYPLKRKRDTSESTTDDSCTVENFTVSFMDLGLSHIVLPFSADLKQCAGSCSLMHILDRATLATNHARLLASAASAFKGSPSPPEEPCCSPVKYSPLYLLSAKEEDLVSEIRLYPEFVIEECGCR